MKPLGIHAFLDLVQGTYLSEVEEPGQYKRVWSLFQVHFGNPRIHWEVWPQKQHGRVEIGLHFESEREHSYAWAGQMGEFMGDVIAELGPGTELEEWTASWTRLHETMAFDSLTPELAHVVGERLAAYVTCLRPLLVAGDIPYTVAPPPRKPSTNGRGRWDKKRKSKPAPIG
jgi:hypothetical protein